MITPNTLLQNRYLVIEKIGHGGMGAVYKATDQRFGSTVALKETFFDDAALRRAFEREAHLLNRLRHSALPRVSDHFTEDEGQFLVMEFIAGEDLSEMIEKRGGAFPLEQVLGWADQLLDALDYLHTHEPPIIHRDIKPQNLKLASRNQIVLLDFGLAKGTPAALSRASLTGSVFGYSRNYAPLEQMQGTGTDPRSDIYSLAATLYHLVTGAVPPDALTRAMAIVNSQTDPLRPANEIHTQVTPSVADALSKAMQQSAAQRYQTAEEMRAALREAARHVEQERAATLLTAPTNTTRQEQETQLMGALTNARPDAATRAVNDPALTSPASHDAAHPTGLASGHEAATLLNPSNTVAAVASSPSAAAARATDNSVVTRVASSHDVARRRRTLSSSAIGALASVLILLAVAGAYYAYTRRGDAQTSTPTQQQPAQATSETQPTPQTTVESAQPAPEAAAPATQAKQPPTAKSTKPSNSRPEEETPPTGPGRPQTVVVQAPEVPEPPETNEPLNPEEERLLTPQEREQLRRVPRRVRRMLMEQKKAQLQRQRQLEEERRRRRQPYP